MNRFLRVSLMLSLLGGAAIPCGEAAAPANVGEAIMAADAYHDSGAYQKEFDAVIAQAREVLDQEASSVKQPAIVLDIDETTLSNWPEIRANRFGDIEEGACDHLPKGPCGMEAWTQRAQAPVFAATRDLVRDAQARHVAVFFVTGRSEQDRAATEANLHKVGIAGWSGLFLRPLGDHRLAEHYKTPIRAALEQKGYTIVLNIGDQESDLRGGHARHGYQLPNPFYIIP